MNTNRRLARGTAVDLRAAGSTSLSPTDVATRLHELIQPLRSALRAIDIARHSANQARTAPDAVALFYDLARLDGALLEIAEASELLRTEVEGLHDALIR